MLPDGPGTCPSTGCFPAERGRASEEQAIPFLVPAAAASGSWARCLVLLSQSPALSLPAGARNVLCNLSRQGHALAALGQSPPNTSAGWSHRHASHSGMPEHRPHSTELPRHRGKQAPRFRRKGSLEQSWTWTRCHGAGEVLCVAGSSRTHHS